MDLSVKEIAALVGGTVIGDETVRITGLNGIKEARPGEICFVRDGRYAAFLEESQASAVLMEKAPEGLAIPCVEVGAPDLAFAQLLQHCEQEQLQHPTGQHASAVVDPTAELGANVVLDAHVTVAAGAVIGENTIVYAGCYVGRDVKIGANSVLFPNVVIREQCELGSHCIVHPGAVIGADGFGFAPLNDQWMKIPQVGRVIIGDHVEVGANSTIDRATFGITKIGQGTKIDNLVQIGHNAVLGEHCVVAGNAGISGSANIGNHVRVGAQAGVAGHLDIGDGATLAGRAGVTKTIAPGAIVSGFPAVDHNTERRISVAQRWVPDLIKRVKHLERQLDGLKETLHEQAEDNSE